MQHRAVFSLVAIGMASATIVATERGPARGAQPQQGPPALCMAQQACPPQPAGVMQIADYGSTATPIYGFAFGATNPATIGGGGGTGSGKVAFTEATVTRMPDSLSPQLLLDTALGRHLKWVDITLKRGTTVDATYRLIDVIVTAYNTTPEFEQISFIYGRIEFSVGGRFACFDLITNTSCS